MYWGLVEVDAMRYVVDLILFSLLHGVILDAGDNSLSCINLSLGGHLIVSFF